GTFDEGSAGPGAGHRRKGRLAGTIDRRIDAPMRLLAIPSNRGAVPEGHRHQNIFTSSGTSFSPSHCIGVNGTRLAPSHSANCGPPTGGGPSPSGIAIVNDA